MPRVATDARARVLQWLELQPGFWQTYRASIVQQSLAVGRYEMGHSAPFPHVPVEPEPTVHRVDHPIASFGELDVIYGA